MAAIELNPTLSQERILYEAIYREVERQININPTSVDCHEAAKMAEELFPKLGYPVPAWIELLAR